MTSYIYVLWNYCIFLAFMTFLLLFV